ncbi:signal peptidase II [Nonomuraea sp. NPDC005983]|uniref:signal peptidase II n=1 Tax=Nonomuraea sp. NPDC005983 TaxID=3155595 RepID=UPI0033AC3A48
MPRWSSPSPPPSRWRSPCTPGARTHRRSPSASGGRHDAGRRDRQPHRPRGDGIVTDYLHTGWWPTFNLADVFITAGAAALILAGLRPQPASPAGTRPGHTMTASQKNPKDPS